ncbi:MAG: hypothetical protein ACE5FI_16580 [Anaerolineales bacterium]
MTLESFFTLTPQAPWQSSEPSDSSVPGMRAFVNFWNLAALAWGGSSGTKPTLEAQLKEGWVYMSGGTAAPYDEDVEDVICNRERSQIVEIGFQGLNVSSHNQYLLVAGLHALGENAMVRVALFRDVLRTEHLQPGDNTLALLIDCPRDRAWIYVDLKHIKMPSGKASAYIFKGVTCYLL